MRRPPAFLAVVLAVVAVVSSAGCAGRDDGPAVLPADPLCGIFPANLISSMLPLGDYAYAEKGDIYQKIWYYAEAVYLDGGCWVTSGQTGYLSVLTDLGSSFTACSSASIFCGKPCDDVAITLTAPGVGRIIGSGGCVEKESRTFYTAWVQYWGGAVTSTTGPRSRRST